MTLIVRPSPIFEIGDIVRVPFPYVERERFAMRPAMIASRPMGPDGGLIWTLMITSARRGRWPGDVSVGPDHSSFGLPVPCFIRTAKVAVIETNSIDTILGRVPEEVLAAVREIVAESTGLTQAR
jgi:mRNA interferase MazF